MNSRNEAIDGSTDNTIVNKFSKHEVVGGFIRYRIVRDVNEVVFVTDFNTNLS